MAQPEVQATAQPEAKAAQPELHAPPTREAKTETPSDPTPQLVKRVHELYEELGREDVRAVEDWESAERAPPKEESHKP
ncbi:hypothetical protein BSU04_26370 [Caballeronia sordidicola]|uniref:Uncharacterized protein n=1 Tax=Caballeronia sordidicola TaxID=196367 RepID=A0A226WWH8_CABSO|nr:hypothetical protein BSU04_26370 [Caballeronia sordidicola]